MKILHFVLAALTTLSLSANVITPSVAAPTQPTTQFTTAITSGAKQIAVGANHACAITQSDTVKCWGRNDLGQLGDGTTTNRSVPVDAKVVTKPVIQIVASGDITCALYADKTVACWNNYYDAQWGSTLKNVQTISLFNGGGVICVTQQTGEVSCNANFLPSLQVVKSVAIDNGAATICAITNNGNIKCASTDLSYGGVNWKEVSVEGQQFVKLKLGNFKGCGQTNLGHLYCSLFSTYKGSIDFSIGEVPEAGLISDFDIGKFYNTDDDYLCWANQDKPSVQCKVLRVLRDNETPTIETINFDKSATQIGLGTAFSCSLLKSSAIKCWGINSYGQLGSNIGSVVTDSATQSNNLAQPIKSVSTGWDHTCVTSTSGNAQCFGAAMLGQIGNGTHGACCGIDNSQDTNIPQTVISNTAVTQLALGGNHSCAIQNGGAWCWGDNHNGQVGNGNTTDANTPVQVTGLISGVTKLAAGSHNTCAIQNATLKCWGWNDRGQVGDGSTADWWTPTPVVSITQPVSDVAIGGAHACAVSVNGALNCWGRNDYGQLGDGTSDNNRLAPVAVKGISNVVEVAPADTHTCARTINGKVYCWGWNYLGSLGNGSLDWVTVVTPTLVSGINGSVTQIAAERNRTCVLTSLGAVQCWGNGIAAPVTVPGLEANVKSFDIGVDHGCAAMQDNTLRCWGSNAHGQRADSIMASSYISTPVTVVGFDGAPWRSVYLPVVLR